MVLLTINFIVCLLLFVVSVCCFCLLMIFFVHSWQQGEITNFEYLMELNKLSGRTFNDLMQYPIFPFILSDYTNKELPLTSTDTYRYALLSTHTHTDTHMSHTCTHTHTHYSTTTVSVMCMCMCVCVGVFCWYTCIQKYIFF